MLGMKDFYETLKDGFEHVTQVNNPDEIKRLRDDGVLVDTDGYYTFTFGDRNEYELCIEPILDEDTFYVALYKHRVQLTGKLPIKAFRGKENA